MRCLRSLLAIVSVLLFASSFFAQIPGTAPRINGPVDERSLVVLKGSVSSIARAEFDRGQAPASTQLSHVRLVLARTAAQQAALDQYDAELQDKSSPNYHKWLTPQQYGQLYGPADSDIAAIVAWLESSGLQVDPVWPGHTSIAFSGSVAQIEQALHTNIHSFEINGEQFYANTTNPSIPAALASVVSGVARLNTLRPKPHHVDGKMGLFNPAAGKLQSVPSDALQAVRPNLTTGTGTGADPYILYMVPADAATIYNTPNTVLNANFTSGTSYTGTGVTIGIGGDATILAGTVASYRQRFIGDTKQPTITYCDVYTNPPATPACSGSSTGLGIGTADQGEAYIDTELSTGLAPGASIHYYASSDLAGAIEAAVNENTVDIFSLSFGACELDLTTSDNALINGWWQQAATQGIAVTVSSGDDGSAACDNNNTQLTANAGLKVSGFASTPYNIAVGGTDFAGIASAANFTQYVSTTSPAANFYRSALKYIPESTWNDSTNPNTTIAANIPVVDTHGNTNIVAGSGGKSSCIVNTTTYPNTGEVRGTCTSGYAKPNWQRGTGVPADGVRDLPDISLMSGAGGDFAAWLVCTDDTGTVGGVTVTANCSTQSDTHFYFFGFGGTSTAAPAFAGILALVQQKANQGRLGQAASELYDLYNGPHAGTIFHDITVGNISVPCDTGTPDCQTNTAGNLFLTGYGTTTGYDLATGIGSVDVNQLVTYWGTATGTEAVTVTVTPASNTISRNAALSVGVTVKGSATTGNPTNTVTLSGGGYTSAAQTVVASGTDSATSTFNIPANSLAKGPDTLTVSYSGDSHYAHGTGTAAVTVNALTPTVTVTPASPTLNSGAAFTVTALVAGTGGAPTGTATLSGGGYTSTAQNLNGTGGLTFNVPANSFTTAGPVTLTVSYVGDANYNAATGTANVTITLSTFSLSATNVTVTPGAITGNVSSISVNPQGGYTGTVALTAVVTSSPAGAVNVPTLTVGGSPVTITSANPVAATVTVSSTAAAAVRAQNHPPAGWFKAAGGTALAALLLFCLPLGSRRNRRMLSLMLVMVAVSFTAVGCSSSHTTPKTTPSVTVSPSKSTLNTTDAISVAISVSGGTSTATGTVTLSGGGFTSSATALSGGAATISIPAGKFTASGAITLTATYSGDTNFNSASGTAPITVNKVTPTVTVTPANLTINTSDALSVAIGVSGGASTPAATGTVTLTGGGFTSSATTLASGAATINIPANSFTSTGSVTLTGTYAGDGTYATATGTATITIHRLGTTAGTYTVTVTGTDATAHITKTTTFTITVN